MSMGTIPDDPSDGGRVGFRASTANRTASSARSTPARWWTTEIGPEWRRLASRAGFLRRFDAPVIHAAHVGVRVRVASPQRQRLRIEWTHGKSPTPLRRHAPAPATYLRRGGRAIRT